jgi:hypothetical protein
MLSSRRIWSTLASNAALVAVASCVSCSADSPNPDARPSAAGSEGTAHGTVGVAGGSSGQTAGSAGTSSGTRAGSSGTGPGVGTAGREGGTATAGTGGPTGVAGTRGMSGSGGTAVQGGSAGTGGTAGVAGAAGMSGSGGTAAQGGSAGAGMSTSPIAGCEVSPIAADMRSRYQNMDDPYYTKYASANGVIVATGSEVGDEAVVRYCHLLTEMVSNEAVRKAIIADEMWFTMISENEQLSSLPQIDRSYGTSLDRRARGLGGLTPTICAEDSIMCMPGDRWKGDCICPHETGHTLYSSGIARVSDLSSRLTSITQSARSSGRLANAYVWQDGNESGMMAWGVQVWYDCAINGTNGAYHSDINTRAELKAEMPEFHQFLSELLPADNKYEDCYAKP